MPARCPALAHAILAMAVRVCAVTVCAGAGLAAATAHADANADKIAQRAKAAYDRGEFDAAASLFWQAWTAESSRGEWLYSAARASERAGLLDDAAQRYELFLRDPRGGTDKVALAREHLREVQVARAKGLLRRATDAATPALGYRHAREAADILWDNVEAWLQAAELADRAGLKPEAAECYQTVSRLAPAGSTEHRAAMQRIKAIGPVGPRRSLAEVRAEAERQRVQDEVRKRQAAGDARRKAEQDEARAAEEEADRKAQQFQRQMEERSRQRIDADRAVQAAKDADRARLLPPEPEAPKTVLEIPQWAPQVSAWTAAALGVGGAALITVGLVQQSNLRDETTGFLSANSNSKPIPMSYAQAQARAQSAASLQSAGWGLATTGLVALGASVAFDWLRKPDKSTSASTEARTWVHVRPNLDGLSVGIEW